MTVLITFTTIGTDAGPFNLYSNVDGYSSAFATGVSRTQLLAGYPSSAVPNGTTIIRVKSFGVCTNFYDMTVLAAPTTTTTTGVPTTTTSTTSGTTSTTTIPPTTTTSTTLFPPTTTTSTTGTTTSTTTLPPTTTTSTTGVPTTTTSTTEAPHTTTTTTTVAFVNANTSFEVSAAAACANPLNVQVYTNGTEYFYDAGMTNPIESGSLFWKFETNALRTTTGGLNISTTPC